MNTEGKPVDSVIQYQLHRKAEGGGGGSGDSNEYIVRPVLVEPDIPGDNKAGDSYIRLDKTYLEIKNAIDNNKNIVLIDEEVFCSAIIGADFGKIYLKDYIFLYSDREPAQKNIETKDDPVSLIAMIDFGSYSSVELNFTFNTLSNTIDNYMIFVE